MEAASETRRRPGRPRKYPWDDGKGFPARMTTRQRQDGILAALAVARLAKLVGIDCSRGARTLAQPYDWLIEPRLRTSILAELARLDEDSGEDDDTLRAVARSICEAKTPAKIAVARIRQYRQGTLGQPSEQRVDALQGALRCAIDMHQRAYDLTGEDVARALQQLLGEWRPE